MTGRHRAPKPAEGDPIVVGGFIVLLVVCLLAVLFP